MNDNETILIGQLEIINLFRLLVSISCHCFVNFLVFAHASSSHFAPFFAKSLRSWKLLSDELVSGGTGPLETLSSLS